MEKYISLKNESSGMTLVEVFISVFLASVFMSVYAMVAEIIGTFTPSNSNQLNNSQGVIVDHHKLQLSMDIYAKALAQSGISKNEISNIINSKFGSLPQGCSFNPAVDWNIPVKDNPLGGSWSPATPGYAICLHNTGIEESNMSELLFASGKPGIYILLALPDTVSSKSLATRRLFCRPSPFC